MASAFYSNSQHVDFDSVLGMDDQGMVSMFQALMASGLAGFLGCPAVIYEDSLFDFFENTSVREGVIISTVAGQLVEISEEWFAESFELPVDGLGDLSEIPKDVIFDDRSIVSLSGEPISLSGRKNQMKFEFRLLCDIMAKAISVKAGSFNAITVEKFSLLTAVVCGIRMNWARILFNIFKKMVTPGSKQAKGFAIQISLLLENIPNLELGASSEFPASKILTDKTVHRFVSINDRDGAEEATGAPKPKAASKKRPAADVGAAVAKKKRTSKKKSPLEIVVVAQEEIPFLSVHASTAIEPMVEDQQAEFSKEQPADELPTDKSAASTEERHWFDLSYEELIAKWAAERPITSPADTNDEIEDDKPAVDDPDTIIIQVLQHLDSTSADKNVEPDEEVATMDVDIAGEDQQKSLDDILRTIPVDVPLPSAGMEITKIVMGNEIKIPGVSEKTWFLSSLPKIPADHKGKAILVEKDPIKGNPAQEHYFLINADIDLLVELRAKVIDEVAQFFNSFSLKKLATINIEEMYNKEEQVLSWGETESPQLAIQRKLYILLKYREVLVRKFLGSWKSNFVPGQGSSAIDLSVIELLSDLHLFILEELTKEARAHGVSWKKPCCSRVFEGEIRDRGAVIARSNTSTRSSCWIRTMLKVDGAWIVEPCADRTVFRSAQISQNTVSVAPSVQLSLDQRQSSSTSADSSSSLNFDATDLDAPVSSLPTVSIDFSAALADFQAILLAQIDFKNLFQEARQEVRTIADVQTLRFNEFRKHTLAQNASIFTGLADVRKEVQEVNAKVDILASRVNDVQKDVEATKEAISHQLFEFQSQAQENQNILHAQLSELVHYIRRGGADKKGESGSRGIQQPSNVQIEDSAVRTPMFAQRVEISQRRNVDCFGC
ncbi:hypothetical protein F511_37037 [Dorcoceras hygrometricum]|uniref:Dystroglycan-like n=1 Tax=Dorcoceras hygrometricum TaxID=472368 RepID=A0A2Z7D2Z2_9LAMI|nr:hypothetical protein F511_37037 [Dorcoceras hygrometricum]